MHNLANTHRCWAFEVFISDRAVGASCIISHCLVIICVDVTDTLRVQIALLLQDLVQVDVFLAGCLGEARTRIRVIAIAIAVSRFLIQILSAKVLLWISWTNHGLARSVIPDEAVVDEFKVWAGHD